MDADSIQVMKYSELQKLAKSLGIRANMKIDKLKTALVAHYEVNGKKDDVLQEKIENTEDIEMAEQTEEQKPVKKGKRRGKTTKTTKKVISNKSASVMDTSTSATHKPAKLGTPKAGSGNSFGTPRLGTPKAVSGKSFGTSKLGTPKAVSGKSFGTPKLGTPMAMSGKSFGTPKLGTPKALSGKSSGTPKLGTPKAMSGTPKSAGKSKQQVALLKAQIHKSPIVSKKRSVERMSLSRRQTSKSPKTNSQSKQQNKRKLSQTEAENPKNTKRRRSTFEVAPLPDGLSEEPRPSSRRSTFEVKPEDANKSSPGVTEMLGSMKGAMNNEQMKKSLLNALDRKVQKIVKDSESSSKHTSGIPRFAAFLAQKREQENKKPVTPGRKNWTKIHKREFDKMDSIDVYLKKKKARQEEYAESAKKTKSLLEETRAAINKLKSHKTPVMDSKQVKSSLFQSPAVAIQKNVPFKPSVMSTANMNLNFASQSRKSPRIPAPVFKPTVMSTSEINFNFGKTPTTLPRRGKSVMMQENGSTVPRKSSGTANKSFVTPFKFNASLNHTLNDTKSVKKTFDLQSSLAKPITWKPHKGKLKPVTANPVYTKTQQDHNISVKTPTVKRTTRESRRAAAAKKRADNKFSKQMSHRGIKVQ